MTPSDTLILDTHASIHELVNAGMPERQAETVVRQQARLLEQNLATKADIESLGQGTKYDIETLRQETKYDIETLRQETKRDIETLRQETRRDIESLRHDVEILRQETAARIEAAKVGLIKWIAGLGISIASLAVAADKLL